MQRHLLVVGMCAAFTLLGAGSAQAHDQETNNGVTMTLHVDPDDQPVAGRPATLVIESVDLQGTFSWGACGCTVAISDSTGKTVFQGAATERTSFTFPNAGAYQVTYAGHAQQTTRTAVKKKVTTIVTTRVRKLVHGKWKTIVTRTPKTVVKTTYVTSTSPVDFSIPFALRADAAP